MTSVAARRGEAIADVVRVANVAVAENGGPAAPPDQPGSSGPVRELRRRPPAAARVPRAAVDRDHLAPAFSSAVAATVRRHVVKAADLDDRGDARPRRRRVVRVKGAPHRMSNSASPSRVLHEKREPFFLRIAAGSPC